MSKFTTYEIGNIYKVLTNVTSGSTITATGIQYLNGVLVPANTFTSGDVITLEGMISKNNAVGTLTPYFYWNTTNNLSGSPILLSTSTALATSTRSIINYKRLMVITSNGTGAGTIGTNSTTPTQSDLGTVTGGTSTFAIDWTSNGYLVLAADHTSTSDGVTGQWVKISTF